MATEMRFPGGGVSKAELLWTNSAPKTAVGAFTITGDYSKYTHLIVFGWYDYSANGTNVHHGGFSIIPKDQSWSGLFLFKTYNRRAQMRQIGFTDTTITIENGADGDSGNNSTGCAIPWLIWGVTIKGLEDYSVSVQPS